MLAILLLTGATSPGTAADGDAGGDRGGPMVGREELIGKLIPITGEPLEQRSLDLRIEFPRNSAVLTPNAEAQLLQLGEALVSEALRDVPIGVYGHTDTSGPAAFNRELSERRAQAVAAYLGERFAVAGGRFREVRGYGEERPRPDLPPSAAAQRRVEIVTFHGISRGGRDEEPMDGAAAGLPPSQPGQEASRPPGSAGEGSAVDVPGGDSSGAPAQEDDAGAATPKSGKKRTVIVQ